MSSRELVLAIGRPGGNAAVAETFLWGIGEPGRSRVALLSLSDRATEVSANAFLCRLPPAAPALVLDGGRTSPCRVVQGEGTYDVLCASGLRRLPSSRLSPIVNVGAVPEALGSARVAAGLRVNEQIISARDPRRFWINWATTEFFAIAESDGLSGATWLDVALVPHQLAVVREVLGSPSVAHVLADEVGLGKTIEALMIWSALSTQDPTLRTIIAVPRSLVPQWCLEVRRRAEHRLMAARYNDLPRIFSPQAAQGYSVFDDTDSRRLVIADHNGLRELAKNRIDFDLLVVDEAHRLNQDQWEATESLGSRVKHVLLISATPRTSKKRLTGAARQVATNFARALRLVDPRLAASDGLADVERHLDAGLEVVEAADAALALGVDDLPAQVLEKARRTADALQTPLPGADAGLGRVVRRSTVLDRFIRTRRRSLPPDTFSERRAEVCELELREEELALIDAVTTDAESAPLRRTTSSSWAALGSSRGQSLAVQAALKPIRAFGVDTKLEALLDLCARVWRADRDRKIVIRCEYTATRRLVAERLAAALRRGVLRATPELELERWAEESAVGPVAVIEDEQASIIDLLVSGGDLSGSMLAQLAAFERLGAGTALVLVANDVASVGLNLQFASDLILYDIPWSPDLAEQWIGRLDRIGRRGEAPVWIHFLTHPALPDWELVRLYERIGLFSGGFRAPEDAAREIARLIEEADAGRTPWEKARRLSEALLEQIAADESSLHRAASLDLSAAPEVEVCGTTGRAALRALGGAGLSVREEDGDGVSLTWPRTGKEDPLELRVLREGLRHGDAPIWKKADQIAAQNQELLSLMLEFRRLGDGRWVRRSRRDFVSPRHLLFADVRAELQQDPSVSVGVFRIENAAGRAAAGRYLAVLGRTYPSAGAQRASWTARGLEAAGEDPELLLIYDVTLLGLERALTIVMPPRSIRSVWRLTREGALAQRLEDAMADGVFAELPRGRAERLATDISLLLGVAEAALSRAPGADEVAATGFALSRSRTFAEQRLRQVIERRRRAVSQAGDVPQLRPIRDARARELQAAEAMAERLASLDHAADLAAMEAARVRAAAAAIVEIRS